MTKRELIAALEANVAAYQKQLNSPNIDIKEYVRLKRVSDNYRLRIAELKLEV